VEEAQYIINWTQKFEQMMECFSSIISSYNLYFLWPLLFHMHAHIWCNNYIKTSDSLYLKNIGSSLWGDLKIERHWKGKIHNTFLWIRVIAHLALLYFFRIITFSSCFMTCVHVFLLFENTFRRQFASTIHPFVCYLLYFRYSSSVPWSLAIWHNPRMAE